MSAVLGLALRTLARYVVPLAVATAVVVAPIAFVAFRSPWPRDLATANGAIVRAFVLGLAGWAVQIGLVGAAAPLARSIAAGSPLPQGRALVAALANLARMAVPCLGAIAAVAIGGLALVVPAFVLMVLLALTGASTERGMPAPLFDSAAAVRDQLGIVIAIVAAMLVVDVGLAVAGWKLFAVPLAKKLSPVQWATYGNAVRVVAIGLAATSPVFATLLAATRARAR